MRNPWLKFLLLLFIYAIVTVSFFVIFDALHRAYGKELDDCRAGCAEAVVQTIPIAARRPYSRENLTAQSYNQPFMPPVKYDVPYKGRYTVTRVTDQQIKLVCPPAEKGNIVLACAHLLDNCHIYMVDDRTLAATGWNYEIVLRHELAHCNGWPWNHPGIEKPKRG